MSRTENAAHCVRDAGPVMWSVRTANDRDLYRSLLSLLTTALHCDSKYYCFGNYDNITAFDIKGDLKLARGNPVQRKFRFLKRHASRTVIGQLKGADVSP